MQDAVTKAAGNSRCMKSVSDFMTLYPTYAAFADALVAGTLPFDLNGINPEGWSQQGTPLDKESLLSDETSEMLGLAPEASTPNMAFAALANRIILGTADLTPGSDSNYPDGTIYFVYKV